jgi:alpha-glucosidase (family GH31 glycosyl hydrolase)
MMAGDENFDESDAKNTATAMAAKDISNRAQELFESTYKDGAGMWDIDAQKAYAEAMGWDPNLVKNKNGNKAVYINEEGQEVTISDETARRFLAEQAAQEEAGAKTDEYVKKAEEAVGIVKKYGKGLTAE